MTATRPTPPEPEHPATDRIDRADRIDASEPADAARWARKLDVTPAQITEAVETVGERGADVEMHLKGSHARTNADRMAVAAQAAPWSDEADASEPSESPLSPPDWIERFAAELMRKAPSLSAVIAAQEAVEAYRRRGEGTPEEAAKALLRQRKKA